VSDLGTIEIGRAFWLLAGNTLVHEVGVPVPILPTALVLGARATRHTTDYLELVAAIVIAMLVGNSVWFLAGRRYGTRVLKFLCRFSMTADTCVSRSELAFARWGWSSLVLGRFLPGVGLIAAPLAGALGMSWARFLVLTAAGAALYGGAALGAGVLLREQVEMALRALEALGEQALVVVVVAFVAYLGWRWYRRRVGHAPEVARISVSELRALIAAGEKPLIVDVRGPAMLEIDPLRIPDAVGVSLALLESRREDLPRDRKIVLYCGCPNEASAAQAARLLLDRGYAWARPLAGGIDAWRGTTTPGPSSG